MTDTSIVPAHIPRAGVTLGCCIPNTASGPARRVADSGCEVCAASGTIPDHRGFRQGHDRKGVAQCVHRCSAVPV